MWYKFLPFPKKKTKQKLNLDLWWEQGNIYFNENYHNKINRPQIGFQKNQSEKNKTKKFQHKQWCSRWLIKRSGSRSSRWKLPILYKHCVTLSLTRYSHLTKTTSMKHLYLTWGLNACLVPINTECGDHRCHIERRVVGTVSFAVEKRCVTGTW